MGDQRTLASMAWSAKGKVTRRERFLAGARWDRCIEGILTRRSLDV